MAKLHSATDLDAAFAARFPHAGKPGYEGDIPALFANAAKPESGVVDSVQAMAIRGFETVSGKLVWVRAKSHFYQKFETIPAGDLVQIPESDAKGLVRSGVAELVSDADVAAERAKNQKAAK